MRIETLWHSTAECRVSDDDDDDDEEEEEEDDEWDLRYRYSTTTCFKG